MGIGGNGRIGRLLVRVEKVVPPLEGRLALVGPGRVRLPAGQRRFEFRHRLLRIADHGQRPVLRRIVACGIDGHELRIMRKHRPRSRGEVLKPGADGDDHVRRTRHLVRGGRADHADRAHMRRVVMRHCTLAGNGLRHGHAVLQREVGHFLFRTRIAHAAAGDDERPLG